MKVGFGPLDETGTQLLFRLVAAAYERRSLGLASHWPFEDWGTFLPIPSTAAALLDRLLHHAVVSRHLRRVVAIERSARQLTPVTTKRRYISDLKGGTTNIVNTRGGDFQLATGGYHHWPLPETTLATSRAYPVAIDTHCGYPRVSLVRLDTE